VDTARVYATCGASGLDLCAYRTSDGSRLWRHTGVSTGLAAEAGSVLYTAEGGALNAASGKTITTVDRRVRDRHRRRRWADRRGR
jgi:hypothetical protein